jgi:transposase InsO family protein
VVQVKSLCDSVVRCSGKEESATTWHRRSAGGIRRLWRDEGLRVPQRRNKNRLTGIGVAVGVMSPIRPNVIWAMDFQLDTTADGRTLKMLNVIDEFTREALGIHAPTWGAALRALRIQAKFRFAAQSARHCVRTDLT